MIDISLLRENYAHYKALLLRKDPAFPLDVLIEKDSLVKSLLVEVETLRQKKNDCAKKAQSGVTEEIKKESVALSQKLKEQEKALEVAQESYHLLLLTCPNIPDISIPEGGKEENVVVKEWGAKPTFTFPIKNHVDLGLQNGWLDFEAGAKMAASGFIFYKKEAVKLIYGLAMFMLKNNSRRGFEPMLPPYFANEQSLTVASNFPKFKEDVFAATADGLYAIPTSEVCLANLYRDTILSAAELPIRMTSWTSCFRREAGNYGKMERGLIRIHQFEKVELFSICEPEKSDSELSMMVDCAESLLQKLGLHYRISLLAAQDCSFASAKTYDIEVWLPGQNRYYEVSSSSNCTDFQSRRGKIRYREKDGQKTKLVHTLNASSLAIPRLMVALMETYQQPDGSIALPDVIKNEMF